MVARRADGAPRGVGLAFALALPALACGATIDSYWTSTTSGNWTGGANWSSNPAYPNNGATDTYNVFIDLEPASAYTVTLNSNVTIDNLELNSSKATLNHTAGTFQVLGVADLVAGTYSLNGGTIAGGTWNAAPGTFVVTSNVNNRLDGVTFNGDLNLSAASARLNIANGLALNGTATLGGSGATLSFEGTQAFDNTTIRFDGATTGTKYLTVGTGGALTLGSNAVVQGGRGQISGPALTNYGRISANVSGQSLDVRPTTFTNHGVLEALNGGTLSLGATGTTWTNTAAGAISATGSTLTLDGNWSNLGTITATDSTVNLGGSLTTEGLGVFSRTGGTVNLKGQLDNRNDAITLNDTTGTWRMAGGTIQGGRLYLSDPGKLDFPYGYTAVFDGLEVHGDLKLDNNSSTLRVRNGLALDGTISLEAYGATVLFEGDQVFDGAEIALSPISSGYRISHVGDGRLTLGPNAVVRGGSGELGGTITNRGLISVDQAGRSIAVRSADCVNEGVIEAINGGTVSFGDFGTEDFVNAPGGVVRVTHGTLSFYNNWTNTGQITAVDSTVSLGGNSATSSLRNFTRSGGTVALRGTLDNTGDVLTLDAATGSWSMRGGTIRGGTLNLADGQGPLFAAYQSGSSWYAASGTFDGVTINGDLVIATPTSSHQGTARLLNGASVNGDITLGPRGKLVLSGGATLDHHRLDVYGGELAGTGGGDITLGADLDLRCTGSLTLASDQGATGVVNRTRIAIPADSNLTVTAPRFVNEGAIESVNGGTISIQSAEFRNGPAGVITALTGASLGIGGNWLNEGTVHAVDTTVTLSGTWRNRGVINVSDSQLRLSGTVATPDLGTLNISGGRVYLNGTLNNADSTFALHGASGAWALGNGRIVGGTVRIADGQRFYLDPGGVFDGVTVADPLLLANGSLTLEGAPSTLAGGVTLSSASLTVKNNQTLDDLTLTFVSNAGSTLKAYTGTTLTLGPGALAHGTHAEISGSRVVNQGTLRADAVFYTWPISVSSSYFTNEGLVEVTNGSYFTLASAGHSTQWTNAPAGVMRVANGTLSCDTHSSGNVGLNQGLIQVSNGSADLQHQWTNAGVVDVRAGGRAIIRPERLSNLTGTTLTGGVWQVDTGGVLDFGAALIETNAADVQLSGAGTFNALGSLRTNAGRVALLSGRDFTTVGDLTNSGVLTLGPQSTFSVTSAFLQSDPGDLTFLLQSGAPDGGAGLLRVLGPANLGGELTVDLLDGFSPDLGTRFDIVTAGSLSGAFRRLDLPALPGDLRFDVVYSPNMVSLEVVPEPSALVLLLVAALFSGSRGTRRRP